MVLTTWQKELAAVIPCARLIFGEKGLPIDVHLIVKYAVHHSKAVLMPCFFQCWPVHRFEQGSHTGCAIKVASDNADLLLLWSPSITDDDNFLFNVKTQHEEEESMC